MTTTITVARRTSHLVRVAVLSFALSFVPAVLVAEQLVGHDVVDAQQVQLCADGPCDGDSMSSAALGLVADLRTQGLSCAARPRLTDTVVVEWLAGGAAVVPFDRALDVAAQRTGWLRSYCVPTDAGR